MSSNSRNYIWRDQILTSMDRLFPDRKPGLLGVPHANKVEDEVLSIIEAIPGESGLKPGEQLYRTLVQAALLHDVGFAARSDTWSNDAREHIQEGLRIAEDILRETYSKEDSEAAIRDTLYLIEHHDDTTYSYPSIENGGNPIVRSAVQHSNRNLAVALRVLRQADGTVHAQKESLLQAATEWQRQGLQLCSQHEELVTAWSWQYSVVGNVRLLGRRAMVDTTYGERRAARTSHFATSEQCVQELCTSSGITYVPDNPLDDYSWDCPVGDPRRVKVIRFEPIEHIAERVRNVKLKGDPSITAYEGAVLRCRQVPLEELSPLALYVVHDLLEVQKELLAMFWERYCLNVGDLPGLLTFTTDDETVYSLAPPIVECYLETDDDRGHRDIKGIVDGLHRATMARNLGLDAIRVIEMTEVKYPLVPLPVDWSDVKEVSQVPSREEDKHRFRYNSLSEFPEFHEQQRRPGNDREARYFLYRDLSVLGSRGVREHDAEEKR